MSGHSQEIPNGVLEKIPVNGWRLTVGSSWLHHRSRHDFPVRPGMPLAMRLQFLAPNLLTRRLRMTSSSGDHGPFTLSSPNPQQLTRVSPSSAAEEEAQETPAAAASPPSPPSAKNPLGEPMGSSSTPATAAMSVPPPFSLSPLSPTKFSVWQSSRSLGVSL